MMPVRRESMELTDTRLLLNRLRVAAHSDGASPKSFAVLLKKVLAERAWDKEGFGTFRAFMEAPEPVGLGMTDSKLLDAARLADIEPVARRLLMEEVSAAVPPGRPEKERDTFISSGRPDTAQKVVARLKRDDPELAEKVVRGEISPNAAAREKGWRKPRIVLSSPERIAGSLRKHMPRESLLRLAELLTKED